MRVELREDWQDRVLGKAKVYLLGVKDREVLESTFDELISQGRLEKTLHATPFVYLAFVV
jgi:hypothetical protein